MTQLTCVMTRIELKHVWLAPMVWWHHRRLQRSLATAPGLLRAVLLMESPATFFTLSVWTEPQKIAGAGTIAHVAAVRASHRWAKAVWSTQWHLTRLSPSARAWPGVGMDWTALARLSGVDHRELGSLISCPGPMIGAFELAARESGEVANAATS